MTRALAEIAVVGYVSIDRIRMADDSEHHCLGGGALYASLAIARAGLTPILHAALGSDLPRDLEPTLTNLGIDTSRVKRCDHPTRRIRLDYATQDERTSPHFAEVAWWRTTLALAPPRPDGRFSATVICPAPIASIADALSCGHNLGHVVADTSEAYVERDADAILGLLPGMAIFAPSVAETRSLCPGLDDDEALAALALRGPCIVQKRGADGLVLARAGRPFRRRSPWTGPVVDTTGAGDSVAGALAAGLAMGLEDDALLDLASRMAARAVSGAGPAGFGLPSPF